jgi:acetyl-CoA C-acetyltransferase
MPYVASIGTYLPCWGAPAHRVAGDDESPATREHLAMVAVKNHRHGVNNPKARLRFEITLEQALDAPIVVTPFGLYDCAPQSDGAAALVLAAEDVVDRFTDRPVWIRGVGLGLDAVMHQHKPDMTTFPATTRAAKQAFAMAGMTPADVDVAEVHDFFTGIELISYEDLGFAERFGGYKLVEAEVIKCRRRVAGKPQWGAEGQGPSSRGYGRRTVRGAFRATPRGGGQPGG